MAVNQGISQGGSRIGCPFVVWNQRSSFHRLSNNASISSQFTAIGRHCSAIGDAIGGIILIS